jgi:hypothetical protein
MAGSWEPQLPANLSNYFTANTGAGFQIIWNPAASDFVKSAKRHLQIGIKFSFVAYGPTLSKA